LQQAAFAVEKPTKLRYNLRRSSKIEHKADDMGGLKAGWWLLGGVVPGTVIWTHREY
jgi:hypothetical protein